MEPVKYDPDAFDRVEAKAALIDDEVDKLIESSTLPEEELDVIYGEISTALSDIQDLYLMLDEVVEKIKTAIDPLWFIVCSNDYRNYYEVFD